MLHGRQEREDDNDDVLRAGPRCFEWGVGRVDRAIAGKSPRFFSPDFLYEDTNRRIARYKRRQICSRRPS